VKYLQMDAALGQIRDSKGRFTIKPEVSILDSVLAHTRELK
jgi:hypothetical protein